MRATKTGKEIHTSAMAIQKWWILTLCLLSVALITESMLTEHKTYIIDTLAQNSFIIKTWATRGISFFITVTKENETLLHTFLEGVADKEKEERLLIKYNNSTKEIALLFNNISRNDEGLYHVSTSMYETARDDSKKMENKWNFQLNVLDPGEIKQGYVGENILITEFLEELIFFPRLYHNYQLIAVLRGSSCDVSTNSPFYGRVRCSKDKDNNKIRIEINDVIENDTGLYKLETEGSTTQRWFLNITDITRANMLNIATTPESSDGISSDQPSNVPLPTIVMSSSPVNSGNLFTESEIFRSLTITTVAVVTILFFFACLIWIQRRNTNSLKAVQRIVLETMETVSNVAPSTLRCPHASSRKELWTSPLLNTAPIVRLQYPTTSKASSSDNSTCHRRLQSLDYDKCRIDDTDSIFIICESSCRSNEKLLDVCHECPSDLDGCPFPSDALSETHSEAHLDRPTSDLTGQWQVTRNAEAVYAKVKKLPELSSKNNIKTGALCKDGYEMVDSSHYDNPINGFQRVEIASVSARTLNPTFGSISTSMVDFDNGTKDEECNEIFANVMNTTSTGNVQINDDGNALSIREKKQQEQKTITVIACSDYADLTLK